jgi:alpha-L-rhamnosidase
MSQSVSITRLSFEHYALTSHNTVIGVSHPSPRVSWRFGGLASDWTQQSYEISVFRAGRTIETFTVQSAESLLVPWPAAPLRPRESVAVKVTVTGSDGSVAQSERYTIERALQEDDLNSGWSAQAISCPARHVNPKGGNRPIKLRKRFILESVGEVCRLYITALGVYEISINGRRIGDGVLAPGWQSFKHRHHYQTFNIAEHLLPGENEVVAWVAEGWYGGGLSWLRKRVYGERIGLLAQLEIGGKIIVKTDREWQWTFGAIVQADIYDGETWILEEQDKEDWKPVDIIGFPEGRLISPESPPIRKTQEIAAVAIIRTPSGKTVVDFGQNLVGWVRVNILPQEVDYLALVHAEVLENGELGIRPLRSAKCTDTIVLRGSTTPAQTSAPWEPKFTYHGFRYVQVDGWDVRDLSALTAIVLHTDMESTGTFSCSHGLIDMEGSVCCYLDAIKEYYALTDGIMVR